MPDNKLGSIKEGLISGFWPGVTDLLVPLWKTGSNVQFSEKGIEKIKGWSAPFATAGSTPIRGIGQVLRSGVQTMFFGNTTTIYQWNAVTETSVGTGYTGNTNETVATPASSWSFVPFGTWMLATNGVDAPQINKTASFSALSGPDFTTAEIFMRWGPYILAFNTNVNEKIGVWCDADDPETWVPASTNSAGDLTIREFDSRIIAAQHLGKAIAVYGKDKMAIWSWVGAPNYFGYVMGPEGIGAVSKHCVVQVGRVNYGLSREGFWSTDGVNIDTSIDDPIRDDFKDDINWNQASKVVGFHDEENHQIKWYYPSTSGSGEPDKGWAYDYLRKLWSPLGHGRTSAVDRDVFAYPISADDSGNIFFENFGDDANGSAMTAFAQSGPIDLDDADHVKEIDNIRIHYKGSGLQFRIGTKDALTDTISWTAYSSVALDFDINEIRKAGRYLFIEMFSNQLGDSWDLQRVDFYGKVSGGER